MTDRDPIAAAIREAQRLNTEGDGLKPIESSSALKLAREILEPMSERQIEAGKPSPPLSTLTIDLAIRLRWALRDIDRKRTKLSPVSPEDLRRLFEMGLIEMAGNSPVLTEDGYRAIE